MSAIRYLFDENVDPILRFALLRRDPGFPAWQIGLLAAPRFGTKDPEILIWCEENNFILVTNNLKSMPLHLKDHLATGRHMNGIFTLSESMSTAETVEELIVIAAASDSREYCDLISYLPISKTR